MFISPPKKDSESKQPEQSAKAEQITEEYKIGLAKKFCDERSNGEAYFDLKTMAEAITEEGKEDQLISNTSRKPVANDCRTVSDFCLKLWGKDDCEKIAEMKIWIGMSETQLNLAWGNPNDKNNTTNQFGASSQWVYGDPIYGASYVYLDGKDKDSMKVTSWQD